MRLHDLMYSLLFGALPFIVGYHYGRERGQELRRRGARPWRDVYGTMRNWLV